MPKTSLPLALSVARAGLVTRRALVAAGVHADLGDRLVREGRWTRLAPSVYLTHRGAPSDGQLVTAAREHAGHHLVVTGLVACRAVDLPDVPAAPDVEVLVPPGTRAVSSPYVRVRQTARLPETWRRGGVRYAMPSRAVCDGARSLRHLQPVRALVLGAVAQGHCAPHELALEVEAGAQRGSALLRQAARDAVAGALSAPEAEAADLVAAAVRDGRLPHFLLNPQVTVRGLVVGRPDGWIPGTGVGWQVDSRRHHLDERDFDQTLAVHDRYARYGLTLLHVTPRRLRGLGPEWVEALVSAVAAHGGEPPGLTVRPAGPLLPQPSRPRRVA